MCNGLASHLVLFYMYVLLAFESLVFATKLVSHVYIRNYVNKFWISRRSSLNRPSRDWTWAHVESYQRKYEVLREK